MPSWLSVRTLRICMTFGLVALMLYLIAIAVSATFLPGCAGCHLVDTFADATLASPHAAVGCAECHGGETIESRFSFGVAQVNGMYLDIGDVDPTLASVADASCIACHDGQIEQVVESAGLRILHAECATTRTCVTCHSPTAHGEALAWPRSATMDMCFDCHGTDVAPDACDLCHSARLPKDRVQTGTFAVTHGPNYLETHGMGNMRTCSACHESGKCERCHGAGLPHGSGFMNKHATFAQDASADCTGCHESGFCMDCHGMEMPHPASFTPQHASIVEADGDTLCNRCHGGTDCSECHEKHVHPVTLDQLRSLGVEVPGGETP